MSPTRRPSRDDKLAKAFGAEIRRLRNQCRLSQLELATRGELAVTFVAALEQGRRLPTLATIRKLAAGLGTTMAKMIAGLEDGEPVGEASPNASASNRIARMLGVMEAEDAEFAVKLVEALAARARKSSGRRRTARQRKLR